MVFFSWEEPKKKKKTVPKKLLRRMVWDRDKGICQVCHRKADPFDWELGHNKARSRGGKLTIKNTYVVHSSCNRSQQALSLKSVRRAIGAPETEQDRVKRLLSCMSMTQLKSLAKRHGIRLKTKVKERMFHREVKRPSKLQYVNALSKVMSIRQVQAEQRKMR